MVLREVSGDCALLYMSKPSGPGTTQGYVTVGRYPDMSQLQQHIPCRRAFGNSHATVLAFSCTWTILDLLSWTNSWSKNLTHHYQFGDVNDAVFGTLLAQQEVGPLQSSIEDLAVYSQPSEHRFSALSQVCLGEQNHTGKQSECLSGSVPMQT